MKNVFFWRFEQRWYRILQQERPNDFKMCPEAIYSFVCNWLRMRWHEFQPQSSPEKHPTSECSSTVQTSMQTSASRRVSSLHLFFKVRLDTSRLTCNVSMPSDNHTGISGNLVQMHRSTQDPHTINIMVEIYTIWAWQMEKLVMQHRQRIPDRDHTDLHWYTYTVGNTATHCCYMERWVNKWRIAERRPRPGLDVHEKRLRYPSSSPESCKVERFPFLAVPTLASFSSGRKENSEKKDKPSRNLSSKTTFQKSPARTDAAQKRCDYKCKGEHGSKKAEDFFERAPSPDRRHTRRWTFTKRQNDWTRVYLPGHKRTNRTVARLQIAAGSCREDIFRGR